jgi:hypothetical protein
MQADHRSSAAAFPGQEPGRLRVTRETSSALNVALDRNAEATHA